MTTPWTRPGKLPDDLQPDRSEPDPDNSNSKVEVEILLTDSPESPPGYEPAPDPPVRISYGRGPELRWGHRKITD